jgi:hypothetical protein
MKWGDSIGGICKMEIVIGDNIPTIENFEEIFGHFFKPN